MAGKDKEAIVMCLDVGPSMNQGPHGHTTSLETAIEIMTLILQRKLFAESKDEVGLVLFGTEGTANHLSDDGYKNITEARPVAPVNLDLIKHIKTDIKPGPQSADYVDALIVAMDLLKMLTPNKKFTSLRLLLFSDLEGQFSDDKLQTVIAGLKNMKVQVNFIGPKFEDEDEEEGGDDNGPSTSDGRSTSSNRRTADKAKTPQQRAGEALIKHILDQVDGEHYSFNETLPLLSVFEKRAVKQTAWKCMLEIGTDFKVPVCGYVKVKKSTQKSWKTMYMKGKGKEYTPKTIRSQHLNNDEETEVEPQEIVEGHRYGNDIIPISEEDKVNMGYKPPGKLMQVLGFTKQENIKWHQQLGNSVYCFIADPGDQHSSVAMSAIINALYETNSVAIVRRTYSVRSNPRLACLIPHIKAKYESLLYVELPFMEDIRQYTFSSLNANKKNKLTDEQVSAVDDLITSMDLMDADVDEEGGSQEAVKPKLSFNPYYQRLCQCLMHRALNPDDPLPPLPSEVTAYLQPPTTVAAQCQSEVNKINNLFKLERIKKQDTATADSIWKDSNIDTEGPSSKRPRLDDGGDFSMAGMAKGAITKIGTVDPIGDFKAMISQKDEHHVKQASEQMQDGISKLIHDSFGSQFYSKAMDCLKVFRQELIKLQKPCVFNDYMRRLKDELKENSKMDFFELIQSERIKLIDASESSQSKVSIAEAAKYLEVDSKDEVISTEEQDEDADDLLGMM
ncbi:X-ray repair cross-complementing protein 5-like isoform X1 [Asterias amurensis]|uniref:X-ray repair cross-complementing protein 5-like isoform X1 n=1 Tax=Asterias amurensis TaxID=7602 RepID=UPI003AB43804